MTMCVAELIVIKFSFNWILIFRHHLMKRFLFSLCFQVVHFSKRREDAGRR